MSDTTLLDATLSPPDGYWCSVDGRILNIANGDIGNTDTSYTYIPLAKGGFNIFSLQFTITATTLTIEVSNSAYSVADSSATWTDVTSTLTGSSTVTATGSLTVTSPFPWSRMRVKRVTTNATNALVLNLTRMRVR